MAPTIAQAPAPARAAAAAAPGMGWKQRAAQFYCLLIIFGFPLFSVPCQKGVCTSPLEVVVTYTYVKDLLSDEWAKTVLYPASLMVKMEVLMGDEPQSFQLPEWDSILSMWNLSSSLVEEEKAIGPGSFSLIPNFFSMIDPNNPKGLSWEFVGACAVCIVGAFLSFLGPNKISFWGIMLVLWFIYIEGGKRHDIVAQPMFGLAIVCSLGWVNFREMFSFPKEEEAAAATPSTSAGPSTPSDDGKVKVESKKKQ